MIIIVTAPVDVPRVDHRLLGGPADVEERRVAGQHVLGH